ncbi:MAG: DUF362 domain-containing protein [Anaerolineales bacterium]|nr:DUF362 domain-containing protein [Anaerolineales bacterium]
MKTRVNRRKFLRLAATGFGSILAGRFLSACGRAPHAGPAAGPSAAASTPTTSFIVTDIPAPFAASATSLPTGTPTASDPAYLAVAHGGDDPEALVRSAISALGGMGRFVPSGAKVVIKPNICSAGRTFDQAATTNPWVVGALVRLCREANAGQVLVLDYPFYKSSREAYVDSGIQEQVEAAGGTMHLTSTFFLDSNGAYNWVDYGKWADVTLPDAKRLKTVQMIDEILNADVLINVPVAKNHDLTRLTLGMKNLMGTLHDRPAVHSWIAEKLSELVAYLRPALTVVDAVRILTANGPRGGNRNDVKKTDTVIASSDIVAADAYATSLFGLTPEDIGCIVKGAEAGLGTRDLSSIRIQEIALGG